MLPKSGEKTKLFSLDPLRILFISGLSSISAPLKSSKYTCNLCEYTGPDMGGVQYHKKVKHGKYSCKSCLFMTDSIKLRNQHIQTVHGYQCGLCDFHVTSAKSLKGHIKSKHDCIRYPCDKCDYNTLLQFYIVTKPVPYLSGSTVILIHFSMN